MPGHHLQLGTWAFRAGQLSRFQVSLGSVSATTEGWALYAERLVDELGYLDDPGVRLGYLDNQRMRAVRVIIDLGMHLSRSIPTDQPFHPGERWDAAARPGVLRSAQRFPAAFVDSEVTRYLGGRARRSATSWASGPGSPGARSARARAEREARAFDLRAWHTAALGLGSLGLGDLERELAVL